VKLIDVTDPRGIEARSMEIIEAEAPRPLPASGDPWLVLRRMIHASADFELLALARFHPSAVESGIAALARGCTIFTDTEMVRSGIPLRRLAPLGCTASCLLSDPAVLSGARETGRTRAALAVDAALARIATAGTPAIFVIGNAPTALLRLLERLDQGAPAPALVIGMPVGFVNAAESKELLVRLDAPPWITVAGRKGGSALAAAAVNALADLALERAGLAADRP